MLTDRFQRAHTYLRISLTEHCNLRCLYCMPEEGLDFTPPAKLLSAAEILRLGELFAAAGVEKIRLTGGEPTLRKDLVDITRSLSALPGIKHVGMTTNGIVLHRHLAALQAAGLSQLNISLDTLRPDRFERMTRRKGLEKVLRAIDLAAAAGFDPVKVNVVVMRGSNEDEMLDFVELTRAKPINVRFIEWMPFDGNVWSDDVMVPYAEMKAIVEARHPDLRRRADPKGEVAKNFEVSGFAGSVSFITSMTEHFCGDCNRIRLMADGNLKVCLFGNNEVSLRDAMRAGYSDEQLVEVINSAVKRKHARHAGMYDLKYMKNRAMTKIGG